MKDKRRSLQRPVQTRPAQPITRPVQTVNRRPAPADQALRDARTQQPPTRLNHTHADRDETSDPYKKRDADDDERDPEDYDDPDDEDETDDEDEPDYEEEEDGEESANFVNAADEVVEEYTASSYLTATRIVLPSGKAIRLRSYSLFSAMDRGELPNTLIKIAREQLYGKQDPRQGTRDHQRPRNAPPKNEDLEISALMDWLCVQMIVSFKCVDKPQDDCHAGEVSVAVLYDSDKVAILQFAMQGQQALRSFRR